MATITKRRSRPPAFINPDHLYRSDELKARLGWKDPAWRVAISKGLTVTKNGRWQYCKGSDAIAFLCGEVD